MASSIASMSSLETKSVPIGFWVATAVSKSCSHGGIPAPVREKRHVLSLGIGAEGLYGQDSW